MSEHLLACFQFLNVPMFRNVTLKCLTEIAGVSVSQYEEQFVTLFTLTMCQLKQVGDTSHVHTHICCCRGLNPPYRRRCCR